jgi:hypothetical protein
LYKVYWTAQDGKACSKDYLDMIEALTETNRLRTLDRRYVTMISENPNQVGKMGVDSIVDGKLPTGEEYTWSKRR